MKKLIYLGIALMLGTTITSCSKDEDSLPSPAARWVGFPIFSAEGGQNIMMWDSSITWDSLYEASAKYRSEEDSTIVWIKPSIEQIGDTTLCGWAKIWHPNKLFRNMMVVKVEPNPSRSIREIRIGVRIFGPWNYLKSGGYKTGIIQYGRNVKE